MTFGLKYERNTFIFYVVAKYYITKSVKTFLRIRCYTVYFSDVNISYVMSLTYVLNYTCRYYFFL